MLPAKALEASLPDVATRRQSDVVRPTCLSRIPPKVPQAVSPAVPNAHAEVLHACQEDQLQTSLAAV